MHRPRLLRVGAFSGFASAACALLNLVLMALAVRFDVERLHDFGGLVDVDDAGEPLLIISMIFDAGFYAFLVPLAVALALALAIDHVTTLRPVRLLCGVAYGVIGCVGALALAFAWPDLFARFDAAGASSAEASRVAGEFASLTNTVYRVVWNLVCATVGALWWLATARAVWSAHRWLARVALALGVVSAIKAIAFFAPAGTIGAQAAMLLLDVYLALLPLFALTAGVSCLVAARRVAQRA